MIPNVLALASTLLVLLATLANAQTLAIADDGTGIRIYFRTAWSTPYIHYNSGSGWTTSPGLQLTASSDRVHFPAEAGWFTADFDTSVKALEFVFTDGSSSWDNHGNANYMVTAGGTYVVSSTVTTPPNPVVKVASDDGSGTMTFFFRTAWSSPYIHYNAGSGWTTAPGAKMVVSTSGKFPSTAGWFSLTLAATSSLEFVMNNGGGTWDNNNNANYKVSSAGTYALTSSLTTPPYPIVPTTPSPTSAPTPTPPSTPTPTPTPTTTPTPTPTPSSPTTPITPAPSTSCSNFNGQDSCTGDQTEYPDSIEIRRWQTPPRNGTGWQDEFQDYRSLQGYAHVVYASNRQSATVSVRTVLRVSGSRCTYSYNGVTSSSATYSASSSLTSDLNIVVSCTSGSNTWTLTLDPVNFVWQSATVPTASGLENGQKGAIVDMFGWPYADIESECSDFLGKAGYLGVKINPPQEAVLADAWPQEGQRNPWYFVYQPVSYRLESRMGTRAQLRSMIQTCRANGIRVYADAVVNHMTGSGNDINPSHRNGGSGSCSWWGPKSSSGRSPYYTHGFQFEANAQTGLRPAAEFPAVPFGPSDFHCERSLNSYTDGFTLANGWLVGLLDLNTAKTSVRERIAQYFVDMMGIGISGFRIDAMKHIGPTDMAAIMGLFNGYMGGSLPDDFVMWGEVIMGGEAQLLACNAGSGYNFYTELDNRYTAAGISSKDLGKLKIWSSDYPKEHPICGSWILPASRFVIQNDDHDQQQQGSTSRDMQDKGSVLVKDKNVAAHRSFETQLFTRTDADWKIKVVLSSYTIFPDTVPAGFPDGLSDCAGFDPSAGQKCERSVPYEKAFRAGSCGYTVEGFASVGKFTRVHRDLSIVNAMRGWVGLSSVTASQVGITSSC